MKKVIYLTCWSDPWISVAEKLKEEYKWYPVYWTGYNDDNSRELVKEHFKDVIYQVFCLSEGEVHFPVSSYNFATHISKFLD